MGASGEGGLYPNRTLCSDNPMEECLVVRYASNNNCKCSSQSPQLSVYVCKRFSRVLFHQAILHRVIRSGARLTNSECFAEF